MRKLLPIANGIALIFTIVLNYLSNTGLLNGNTMGTISGKYENYFTPAGYAFSIWGLIYLGLLCFVFYTGKSLFNKEAQNESMHKIGWWFILSCIANSLWVITWLYDYLGLSVLIMTVLFLSLFIIVKNVSRLLNQEFSTKIFIVLPFVLYFGWVSVALIANVAAYLTKINWSGWGIEELTWTVIMISIAGIVNILMVSRRKLFPYGMVGIWALIAISFANKLNPNATTVVYACYIVSVLILVSMIITLLSKRVRS